MKISNLTLGLLLAGMLSLGGAHSANAALTDAQAKMIADCGMIGGLLVAASAIAEGTRAAPANSELATLEATYEARRQIIAAFNGRLMTPEMATYFFDPRVAQTVRMSALYFTSFELPANLTAAQVQTKLDEQHSLSVRGVGMFDAIRQGRCRR